MLEKPKTRLEIAEAKKAKLLEEAKKVKSNIDALKMKARKDESKLKRIQDARLKKHAGGMVEMVGLFRYVYDNESVRDNPQDALIANLIVGALLRVAQGLEKAPVSELKKIWIDGRDFRRMNKDKRILSAVNPKIGELVEIVKSEITTTKLQSNDNDNLKSQTEKKVEQPNDNKTVS